MHYYQFNIGDYRKQTSHLTLVEHAIYRALLDTYYLTENPLTSDINSLMRSHSVRTQDEQQALKNVLNDFFILTKDGYKHGHCEEELSRLYEKSDKARSAAKARWLKNKENNSDDANAMQTQCSGDAKPMLPNNPLPNNPLPKKERGKPEKRFSPPTLEEVNNYFVDRGEYPFPARSEAEKFIDFYQSKNWYVGKNKMKDWQAAVRNWMRKNHERHQRSNQPSQQQHKKPSLIERVRANCGELPIS